MQGGTTAPPAKIVVYPGIGFLLQTFQGTHQQLTVVVHGDAEIAAVVHHKLELVGLADAGHKKPGELSGGMRKRAGLARALALKPEVLLVDNPLAGLDRRHVHWWLGFLDQLSSGHKLMQSRPVTLVVTASDSGPWKGHARQFAVLRNHSFVALGAWEQLEAAGEELLRELLTVPRQTE